MTLSPTIFMIFGITGDLAGRKLLPALLGLYSRKMLPAKFVIIGIGRRPFNKEDFRQFIREHIGVKHGQYREEDIKHFLDHIEYVQGLFDTAQLYKDLADRIINIEDRFKQCANKLYHLAVPPSFYETILKNISELKLHEECADEIGWTRILVEKPFGNDVDTATKLDKLLASLFQEKQIFRIDHYLAKESLQNILTFRFSNSLFEPLWNSKFIDRIHIRLLEKDDVHGRGAFYDNVGALKDVGQNHVLQMMALIAMDEPIDFNADSIRKERAKILKNIEPFPIRGIKDFVVKGQYDGYTDEKGVDKFSKTETYFLLKCSIDSSRWKNVPFFLESGKGMNESKTEICVYFKSDKEEEKENVLVFRIQPDEGIKIRFWVKKPGFPNIIEPKTLAFKYSDLKNDTDIPDAYEKLIYDAVLGDQTLFASTDEVIYAWKYITPIIRMWTGLELMNYKKGSTGPLD